MRAEASAAVQPTPTSITAAVASATVSAAVPSATGQAKPVAARADEIPAPLQAALGQPAPVQQTLPTAPAAAAQSAAPASPAQPAPLAGQVAAPIFTLARAGVGEHVLTVTVTPDNLGPVTVRAQVGGDGIRVDLFAPTDAGRDALRSALPDLRKDLSAGGLSAQLNLSSQNQPSDAHGGAASRTPFTPLEQRQTRAGLAHESANESAGIRRAQPLSTSTIDVLA